MPQVFPSLEEDMNMSYINVTLDVGATISAYKLLWNTPNSFPMLLFILGIFI